MKPKDSINDDTLPYKDSAGKSGRISAVGLAVLIALGLSIYNLAVTVPASDIGVATIKVCLISNFNSGNIDKAISNEGQCRNARVDITDCTHGSYPSSRV